MNKKNRAELLFERYLTSQGITAEYEPSLPGTGRLPDYSIEHPEVGNILFEVKEINQPLPVRGFSTFDPHGPVESHISSAARKFKDLSDRTCVIVLAAGESSFVDLQSPHVMLGAMYGRWGFTVPFDPHGGKADKDVTAGFIGTEGKIVSKHGTRNTRIAAVVSLMDYYVATKEISFYLNNDDGRSKVERLEEVQNGKVDLDLENVPCVTVWENGTATRRLPRDLFHGNMDAWWTADGGEQSLSYVGERRARLRVDR
jgi:hypothetical protein